MVSSAGSGSYDPGTGAGASASGVTSVASTQPVGGSSGYASSSSSVSSGSGPGSSGFSSSSSIPDSGSIQIVENMNTSSWSAAFIGSGEIDTPDATVGGGRQFWQYSR